MLLVHSLLDDAGCNVGITASCGTDVGDEGVAELEMFVIKPRTTIGSCLPDTTFLLAALTVIHEKNWKRLGVLEDYHLPDFP